ncbi:MAG: ABC transporter ATP-binding protein, partial [Thermodesulfobacteriota bacterium]
MNKLVEVTGLTKTFNGVTAVDDISFEIYSGEVLGLLGANGAGKTTTLQMLLGLTTPTAGKVSLFGLDMKNNREEILQRVNFSSSYVSLPYSLTVYENLQVFAMLYGIKDRKPKIMDLLSIFEIEELTNKPVRRLSSGQITRVCLAKSLLNDPEVLFLDEPTASLDPDIADKTRRLLKDITRNRGVAILYTSHNMGEMEEISDRVIFMDSGRIAAS